ncbi:hypothetical protein WR25_02668 [Diploscapter pachys]|uniref:Uncharacterized protein n=1 Tax=Diploscapter pachys TaxID=2018661 RepID=A0A2A2K1K1_9BILA|nr:hypothetical protein WR25_02668 [Diploscapter pachys]
MHRGEQAILGQGIYHRIIALGHHTLSQHHRKPARDREQLVVITEEATLFTEQGNFCLQCVRNVHAAHVAPKSGVAALRQVIVQDDEIAHADIGGVHHAIIGVALNRGDRPTREQGHQLGDALLDQVDAGRFERLQKAAGKPQRDHVLLPLAGAAAGGEAQQAGRIEGRAVEVCEQEPLRLAIVGEAAGVDIAVSGAMLEGDPPLPAGGACGRPRKGRQGIDPRGGHGKGAIAGEPVRPVLPWHGQGLSQEQAAEAGAVHEQVCRELSSILQAHAGHRSVDQVVFDRGNAPFNPGHPAGFRAGAQERGIAARIEMIGISQARERRTWIGHRRGKASLRGGEGGDGIVGDVADARLFAQLQPDLVEA